MPVKNLSLKFLLLNWMLIPILKITYKREVKIEHGFIKMEFINWYRPLHFVLTLSSAESTCIKDMGGLNLWTFKLKNIIIYGRIIHSFLAVCKRKENKATLRSFLPFLVVEQSVVGRESSIRTRFPPASKGFFFRWTTSKYLRFSRRWLSWGRTEVTQLISCIFGK